MPVLKIIYRENPLFQSTLGKYKDDDALNDVISYCTQEGKAYFVGGIGVYPPQAAYEMERLAQAYGKDHGLRLRHWVLSFSEAEVKGIKRKSLLVMLRRFGWYAASYFGGQYQIIYAIHLGSDNPHIHFVMNTVNYWTGKKYPGDKADYYNYQHYLRDFFAGYGMNLIPVSDNRAQGITRW